MAWTKEKAGLVAAGVCAAIVVVALAAGGGRYLRETLLKVPPDTTEAVAGSGTEAGTVSEAVPDELYTWVDSKGVTRLPS